jgi:hypothetical protein
MQPFQLVQCGVFILYNHVLVLSTEAEAAAEPATSAAPKAKAEPAAKSAPAKKTSQPKELTLDEIEKIKARAERFGATVRQCKPSGHSQEST